MDDAHAAASLRIDRDDVDKLTVQKCSLGQDVEVEL
jgi:hypothetical protein